MFHGGRCGSTVLGDMLNHHSRCQWDSELFLAPNDLGPTLEPYHRWPRSPYFPDRPFSFVESQASITRKEWYGFEVQFYQLREINTTLGNFIKEVSPLGFDRHVVLTRRNYLRVIVSKLLAAQKAEFHFKAGAQPALQTMRINVESVFPRSKSLRSFFKMYDATIQNAAKALTGKSVIWLNYEDHIQQSPRVAYRTVCEFLRIEPENPPITFTRSTPWPLCQIIENYDEVVAHLRGTSYEWMTANGE